MVWSQFSINILGLHFSNSLLDNYNWEKIRHSLTKHSVTLFGMKKKKKKKKVRVKENIGTGIFSQTRRKRPFNNLTRNKTSREEVFFS